MAVTVNFQIPGLGRNQAQKLRDQVVEMFNSRPGRWHVQFIGDDNDDAWEVRISGPGVETSGYADRAALQRQPESLSAALQQMLE